jgi:hypothetical protein
MVRVETSGDHRPCVCWRAVKGYVSGIVAGWRVSNGAVDRTPMTSIRDRGDHQPSPRADVIFRTLFHPDRGCDGAVSNSSKPTSAAS